MQEEHEARLRAQQAELEAQQRAQQAAAAEAQAAERQAAAQRARRAAEEAAAAAARAATPRPGAAPPTSPPPQNGVPPAPYLNGAPARPVVPAPPSPTALPQEVEDMRAYEPQLLAVLQSFSALPADRLHNIIQVRLHVTSTRSQSASSAFCRHMVRGAGRRSAAPAAAQHLHQLDVESVACVSLLAQVTVAEPRRAHGVGDLEALCSWMVSRGQLVRDARGWYSLPPAGAAAATPVAAPAAPAPPAAAGEGVARKSPVPVAARVPTPRATGGASLPPHLRDVRGSRALVLPAAAGDAHT